MASGKGSDLFPTEKHLVDYQETVRYFHDLASTRFKLLTLVPGFTGVALATLLGGDQEGASKLIAIGAFGFLVVFGIVFYDVRNTHIYDMMQIRAKNLEAYLGLPRAGSQHKRGGPLLSRPSRKGLELFKIPVWHDRGLAIVYSSCLSAWLYIILRGVRNLLFDYISATLVLEVVVGSILAFAVSRLWVKLMAEFKRLDTPTDEENKLTPWARHLLKQRADDLGFDELEVPEKAPNPDPAADV